MKFRIREVAGRFYPEIEEIYQTDQLYKKTWKLIDSNFCAYSWGEAVEMIDKIKKQGKLEIIHEIPD